MQSWLLGLVVTYLSTSVLMLASDLVADLKIAVPVRIPSISTRVTPLENREDCVSAIQATCQVTSNTSIDADARDKALRTIVSQLQGQTGKAYTVDMSHSRKVNLGSSGEWKANIFITDRVPELQNATFTSLDLAYLLDELNEMCCQKVKFLILGNENEWLPNCFGTLRFKGTTPKSYQEGAAAIVFVREI
ncbi:hypothetical protein EJ04DRAFT_571086 [Polyplosphaeria fusca]|uniref:Uncharacterized protein n=1 Tax=Polyplosphaeria fusca TaxID=682080 RepID=A0A9P4QKM0_9PLEO|nr:hypothetical protein EJ04DRAFT_571086 [Polyplosphaeria fusca]